ncbi:S-adenosyl-L-methionine-dependent methyltransferase [Haematococcus lacustris]
MTQVTAPPSQAPPAATLGTLGAQLGTGATGAGALAAGWPAVVPSSTPQPAPAPPGEGPRPDSAAAMAAAAVAAAAVAAAMYGSQAAGQAPPPAAAPDPAQALYSGLGGFHYSLQLALQVLNEDALQRHPVTPACHSSNPAGQTQDNSGSTSCVQPGGWEADVVAIDVNQVANRVYAHNFQHQPLTRDLNQMTAAELDSIGARLWCLSPPCQPFTTTRNSRQRDADDPRSASFLHLLSLLPHMAAPPDFLLLENVLGFAGSHCHRRWLRVLLQQGYRVEESELSPHQLGLPYLRPRFFSLAKAAGHSFVSAPSPPAAREGEEELGEGCTRPWLLGLREYQSWKGVRARPGLQLEAEEGPEAARACNCWQLDAAKLSCTTRHMMTRLLLWPGQPWATPVVLGGGPRGAAAGGRWGRLQNLYGQGYAAPLMALLMHRWLLLKRLRGVTLPQAVAEGAAAAGVPGGGEFFSLAKAAGHSFVSAPSPPAAREGEEELGEGCTRPWLLGLREYQSWKGVRARPGLQLEAEEGPEAARACNCWQLDAAKLSCTTRHMMTRLLLWPGQPWATPVVLGGGPRGAAAGGSTRQQYALLGNSLSVDCVAWLLAYLLCNELTPCTGIRAKNNQA